MVASVARISRTIWQRWEPGTAGKWRQVPETAGGGFMFDMGAHLLNIVADLAGEAFVEVAAWTDNCGRPVETLAVVIGRLASGALVTLHGCGETVQSCASDIRVRAAARDPGRRRRPRRRHGLHLHLGHLAEGYLHPQILH